LTNFESAENGGSSNIVEYEFELRRNHYMSVHQSKPCSLLMQDIWTVYIPLQQSPKIFLETLGTTCCWRIC